MGLLGGFKGKLKGTKQKSRKSISTEVVCVKYKVNSEFDSDNSYPSSSRENGGATAVVNQKKPRIIPDAQNLFKPPAVRTHDPFKTVVPKKEAVPKTEAAPKTEATKADALKGTKKEVTNKKVLGDTKSKVKAEGTKKKSSKTKAAVKPNSSKVAEPTKAIPNDNKKDDEAKPPMSPVFKTVQPKTETEKADTSKAQKVKNENASKEAVEANRETTQVKNEQKKSQPIPKSPEVSNEAKELTKSVKPKKKQAPKAKASKKEIEKKLTPTATRKAEVKKETEKPDQANGIKVESPDDGLVLKPDENANIYAEHNKDDNGSFKVHVVDHANSFYSNLSDAETTEAEDNDDFKYVQMNNSHSPINYSSQAASIFFGGEEEVVVRPRTVVMHDDDVSQGSSASA